MTLIFISPESCLSLYQQKIILKKEKKQRLCLRATKERIEEDSMREIYKCCLILIIRDRSDPGIELKNKLNKQMLGILALSEYILRNLLAHKSNKTNNKCSNKLRFRILANNFLLIGYLAPALFVSLSLIILH